MGKKDMEVLEQRIKEGEEKEEKAKRKARRKEMKAKKDSFFADFKKFITRGNVLDMAVGVIVGGAFTGIINALSNNILKPVINFFLALILGEDSLSEIFTFLKRVDLEDGTPDLTQSIYIDWGAFINAIINFLLIAFTLFVIVRTINNIRKRIDADQIAAANAAAAKAKEEADAKAAVQAEAARLAAEQVKAREDAMFDNMCKQTELLAKVLEAVKK